MNFYIVIFCHMCIVIKVLVHDQISGYHYVAVWVVSPGHLLKANVKTFHFSQATFPCLTFSLYTTAEGKVVL